MSLSCALAPSGNSTSHFSDIYSLVNFFRKAEQLSELLSYVHLKSAKNQLSLSEGPFLIAMADPLRGVLTRLERT